MEIILATLGYLKIWFGVIAALCIFFLLITESFNKKAIALFMVFSLLTCIPDVDDLVKVRIALIKYQLASPGNVKEATDTIERIGKKLECKYLGCDK